MPKVAILFSILLLSSFFSNSYAIPEPDLDLEKFQYLEKFDSEIIDIDSNFFKSNDYKRYLIFGDKTHKIPNSYHNVYGVESQNGFFHVSVLHKSVIPNLIDQGLYVIEDFPLDYHSEELDFSDVSRIGKITGSNLAKTEFNVNGSGVKIAIIDTGVDFSNPDMMHSVARDNKNHPIMLDPDGQGIVLTNATFFAFIDKDGIIRNYSKKLPEGMTSSVYVTKDGVFLDVSQKGKGTQIPIYNSFFPQAGSSITFNGTLSNDMKIGQDNRNYIKSKSGVYHLGVIYQGGLQGPYARIQVVPVLFVDSNVAGVYDTIIPDMSTSWKDYTRFELKSGQKPDYDFDFTDEKPIILGSGNEFLVYDSNNDGRTDYSAGTVGAQVLDVHRVIQNGTAKISGKLNAVNGTLLPGLDPDGNFFGVMTDFVGHGTASASSIVSSGKEQYDIYNNTKKYQITGVAPGAKIIPVKALWFGDTVYSWLWSAGFENSKQQWTFTGEPKADIISNSWGVSTFPSFKQAPGMDILSLILSLLATPQSLDERYPGITIVSSAGNSGHGYGTIGLPNASPFGISVGATTNNVFVGYGPFNEQPRFGNTTTHFNHVVDFSSRGPGVLGDPKPDLMSIGAHGFVSSNVLKTEKNSKKESFSLFGGTSMAAPLVSGTAALLIEGLQKSSKTYDSFDIKNILMSTADDLQNDPLTQGAGLTNIYNALKFVNEQDGIFIVTNNASYQNVKEILDYPLQEFNHTSIGFEKFEFPTKPKPVMSWFAGHLEAGQKSTAEFTIDNPSNQPLSVTITPQTLSLIQYTETNGTTIPRQQDSFFNKTNVFAPNYVKLSDIKQHKELGDFYDDETPIPKDSKLLVLNVNFPFDTFMNKTADRYANDLRISSLYLYDWIDKNNDTDVSSDELSLVNRAGSWGTVQELRVSEPDKKFDGTPLVGIYPVPTRYSFWNGDTKQNSTSLDYTLSARYYDKQKWSDVWTNTQEVIIPPNSKAKIKSTLTVPDDYTTGVYQGFLTFSSKQHTVNVPVSFVVKQPVSKTDSTVLLSGKNSTDVMYGNGFVKGAFDMTNRYMAGDWRNYYFDIKDNSINTAAIEMSWKSDDTNLAVFVIDPKGRLIQTNMPSGVFGKFLGWPSLDWLGNSPFSQGGGFYPVKNKDSTSTVMYVPINQTGTYSLMAHSTLFGGDSTTEPITLAAKFLNISTDEFPSQTELIDESTLNFTEPIDNATQNKPQNDSEKSPKVINPNQVKPTDNSLLVGLSMGIIIGIAIGIIFILLIRKNSSKP